MDKKEKYAIGVDLGGTSIKLGIVSNKGKIVQKYSLATMADKGPDAVMSQIKKGIKELLKENKKYKINGIGIGSPGVVSVRKGTVENPPNFSNWKKVNVVKIIEKEFKKKTVIENDANAAAIGELMFRPGKKLDDFIFITLGTGVGGGIILNGKIFRGETGGAGEVGHMTIDYAGPKCNCGSYGCVESYLGNNYLIGRVKKQLAEHPESKLHELAGQDYEMLTPKLISEAAEMGDVFAHSIITESGALLGYAIANVVNLLDVANIVIGGGVAGFGKPLFDAVEIAAKERALKSLSARIKIYPAKLKNEAGIKGASALVYYNSAWKL
ncbi:MAG TPA: ROK family protein [Ignavibacteriales bacterium]|nr:ROK family protein [Ignavibacteriales bacterium]